MVLANDWGMQETSHGPLFNIKSIELRHSQGGEVFRRQFSICFAAPRWRLHSMRQAMRYVVLERTVFGLLIAAKPSNQTFVFPIFFCWYLTVAHGGNIAFTGRLRGNLVRRLWNVFIGVWDESRLSSVKFSFLYSLKLVLPCKFHLLFPVKSCAKCGYKLTW